MRAITKEKLDQAREEIQKRKDERNAYVKSWRQTERIQKRVSYFIEGYVREKYENIYSEAVNFYAKLDRLYPKKIDLRKTKEFQEWKQTIPDDINRETLTAATTVNHINSNSSIDQSEQQQTDNLVLRIPLLPLSSTPQAPPPEDRTVEIPQPTTPQEMSSEIPQEIGAECTIEMPPFQFETPAENDEGITDQRIREIIQELQNDPDLNGIFDDIQPTVQNDEGIELPSIEEEIRVDLALIDQDPDFHAWSNMEVDLGLVD